MTPKQLFKERTVAELTAIAVKAGTNYPNFRSIALYGGSVSARLAKALVDASAGELTLEEILFQDKSA